MMTETPRRGDSAADLDAAGSDAPSRPDVALQEGIQRLVTEFFHTLPDPDRSGWSALVTGLVRHPERLADLQRRYADEHARLWAEATSAGPGQTEASAPSTAVEDPRFAAAEWREVPFFRLLRDSYLLHARWLDELVDAAELPPAQRDRVRFLLRRFSDALAPSNFAATNPDVIRLATQTAGDSLVRGLQNLRADLARGRLSMTHETAFEVGVNVAATAGAVVFENDVMQLIQYAPRAPQVRSRPVLIVPPFINKYYILDLQPENSFVRFALEQELQVFVVSWRNVPEALGHLSWDDYVRDGVLAGIDAVTEVSGSRKLNVVGFCVGGTLLASALATMPDPERVTSVTLLATLLDFSAVGDIGVYVDAAYVEECEQRYASGGVVPGGRIATAFASLRANELVWSSVINHYLKGRAPRAFDLLFWNADSSNLPGPLYAWYLRNMYLENRLRQPGRVQVLGKPVDLGRIRAPAFMLATRDDHIVPWVSAFAGAHLLGGSVEFVLGASGHVAGIVNPPAPGRRQYWQNSALPEAAEAWLAEAVQHPGSWWPHWVRWIARHAGRRRAARQALGSKRHPPVEPAPGRYVRERLPGR